MLTEYPVPPSGQALEPDDPDASFMLSRLDLYRRGREPLADVAYLCLTVLEDSISNVARGKGNRRKLAANHYQIERKVLEGVGELSSKKGGSVARKAEGRADAFTREETRFLEAAVTAFTRRAAEKAGRILAETYPSSRWATCSSYPHSERRCLERGMANHRWAGSRTADLRLSLGVDWLTDIRLRNETVITANVIYRVFRLKVDLETGTAFTIEEGGRE